MSAETRNDIYGTLFRRIFSPRIFAVAWKALHYWPALLTQAKRREFGLYHLDDAPPFPAVAVQESEVSSQGARTKDSDFAHT
jgi:hypothetical protein